MILIKKFILIAFSVVLVAGVGLVSQKAFADHILKEITVDVSTPMVLSISGDTLFVSNFGKREITIIDTNTDQKTGTIETSGGLVAVFGLPDKNKIYAATFESGGIDVYNLETGLYEKTIELPNSELVFWHSPLDATKVYSTHLSTGMSMDYDSRTQLLYVASYSAGTIEVINTKTDTVIDSIKVPSHPITVRVDPQTSTIIVTNAGGQDLTFIKETFDTSSGIFEHAITKTIKTGSAPWGIDVDTDDGLVYVSNRAAHHISVIDVSSKQLVKKIPLQDESQAIAIDQDNDELYVSFFDQNKIAKIDAKSGQILHMIETDGAPWHLMADSAKNKIYASIKDTDKILVLEPTSVSETLPVITLQTPVSVVGDLHFHGKDVLIYDPYLDVERKSLSMSVDSKSGGILTLTIPRVLLDSHQSEADSSFEVFVNGNPIDHTEKRSDEHLREIQIIVPKGAESLEIIGTKAIPEFGIVAIAILVAGIISAVFAATKYNALKLVKLRG